MNDITINAGGLRKPPALRPGGTLAVFAPRLPAHIIFRERYLQALDALRTLGYTVVEGPLTGSGKTEGYRTAGPIERAEELQTLWFDPTIDGIMTVIGGQNSSSMLPHLDLVAMGRQPKVFCGYSDVTSLHMALASTAKVSSFYGPAVVPSFGELPAPFPYTVAAFRIATGDPDAGRRALSPPSRYSRAGGSWTTDAWKAPDHRTWEDDAAWRVIRGGEAHGPLIAANLSTLRALAGTPYLPDFTGKILLIEEMTAPLSTWERGIAQLHLMGVFDRIAGLIIGKPEFPDRQGAPFDEAHVLLEVVADDDRFPIIHRFDCSHTHPMLTLAQGTGMTLEADDDGTIEVWVEESMVLPTSMGQAAG